MTGLNRSTKRWVNWEERKRKRERERAKKSFRFFGSLSRHSNVAPSPAIKARPTFTVENLPPGGKAGLPDGIFSYQKSQFGYISERLGMENVDIFYGHLEYIEAIWYMLWYILRSLGMYIPRFWYIASKKSGNHVGKVLGSILICNRLIFYSCKVKN
jgi:hypothetical protein